MRSKLRLFLAGWVVMEQDKDQRPISFPQWAEALPRLLLSPMRQQQYRFSIIQYLRFCKQTGQRATVTSARTFIHDIPDHRHLGVSQLAVWKEALNWFFKAGRTADSSQSLESSSQKNRWNSGSRWQPVRPANVIHDVPSLGALDTGNSEWERRLIQRLRTGHYLWRTEPRKRLRLTRLPTPAWQSVMGGWLRNT